MGRLRDIHSEGGIVSEIHKQPITHILHLTEDQSLTVIDALANQVSIFDRYVRFDDWVVSEGSADPMDVYQEVCRQLAKQEWSES